MAKTKHQPPGLFCQKNCRRTSPTINSWNAYPKSGQDDHSAGIFRKALFKSILLNIMRVSGPDGRRKRKIPQIIPRTTCPDLQPGADENSVSASTPGIVVENVRSSIIMIVEVKPRPLEATGAER